MRILPLLIIGTIVLFCAALVAPSRSRRLQGWTKKHLHKGEKKSRGNAGRIGDWTAKSLKLGRKWVDMVMHKGRRARGKLPGEGGP